jgi:hypothetical protein
MLVEEFWGRKDHGDVIHRRASTLNDVKKYSGKY